MRGILLDADSVEVDGEPVIRLFVADGDQRKQAFVPGFKPYFYVVPDGTEEEDRLVSILKMRSKRALNVEMPRDAYGKALGWDHAPSPIQTEWVERKINAKPVRVIKVTCKKPKHIQALRGEFRRVSGVRDVREAGVYLPKRWMIDHNIRPFNVIESFEGLTAEVGDIVASPIWSDKGEADLSNLRIFAFDFEMVSPKGFPKADTTPIALCSWADSSGKKGYLHAKEDILSGELDDRQLVQDLLDLILAGDYDVILTYNGDDFDWPYFVERASIHGIQLNIGRDGSAVRIEERGDKTITRAKGRALVDLFVMVERDIMDLRAEDGTAIAVKSLKVVAEALGVVKRTDRVMVEETELEDKGKVIARMWREDRASLIQYAMDDVVSTIGVGQKLLAAQFDMCRVTRNPLSDAYHATRGQQVEMALWDFAFREGEVVPPRPFRRKKSDDEEDDKYEGAFVFEPEPGLHEDVQWEDFEALYPSIMIERNIGPDTFVAPEDVAKLVGIPIWTSPAGHSFRQDFDSFFKKVLVEFRKKRIETKKAKKLEEDAGRKGSAAWTAADNRDKAFKAVINSFYGFTGWKDASYYHEQSAVSVTSEGVRAIKRVREIAIELGMHVIAGDTDSVALRGWTKELLAELERRVTSEMPLTLAQDDGFAVMFFTGKKKRYCGLTYPDKHGKQHIVVKGLETRRTDWCETAKHLQMEVITTLLRQRDPQAAMLHARTVVAQVKDKKVPLSELAIYRRLTKAPELYENKMAHVEAIKRAWAKKPDLRFPIGDKVGYVICESKLDAVTAKSVVLQVYDPNRDRIDFSYYNERQVIPAALRILEFFGYTKEDLLALPKQKTLDQEWQ